MKTTRVLSLLLIYLSFFFGVLFFSGLLFFGYYDSNSLGFLNSPYIFLNFILTTLVNHSKNNAFQIKYLAVYLLAISLISSLLYLPFLSIKSNKKAKIFGLIFSFIFLLVITFFTILFLYSYVAPGNSSWVWLNKFAINNKWNWKMIIFSFPAILLFFGWLFAAIHFNRSRHLEKKNLIKKVDNDTLAVNLKKNNKDDLYEKVEQLKQKLYATNSNNNSTNQNNNNTKNVNENVSDSNLKNQPKNVYYRTINQKTNEILHQSDEAQKLANKVIVNSQSVEKDNTNNFFFSGKNLEKNINKNFVGVNNKSSLNDSDKIWKATKMYRKDTIKKYNNDENNDSFNQNIFKEDDE